MSVRSVVGVATIAIAGLLIYEALWGNLQPDVSSLLSNLGTELIGILLTVAVIDWLFERRRFVEQARLLAQAMLNTLDHHVWVWQGGAREFDLGELLTLLEHVGPDDPVPTFTQNLFLQLGSNAADIRRLQPAAQKVNRALADGLRELEQLLTMRDGDNHLPATEIAAVAAAAARNLAKASGLHIPSVNSAPLHRDPAIPRQEWRHYGDR